MLIESGEELLAAKQHCQGLERQLARLTGWPRSQYTTEQQLAAHRGEMETLKREMEEYERRDEVVSGGGELAGEGDGVVGEPGAG